MTISLDINGTAYLYPEVGDVAWGPDATDWASAVTTGMLQKAGGLFQLLAETDFGSAYGLKSLYYKSRGTNPSSTGIFRLANNESVGWRNAANGADLLLKVNASDILEFNGNPIPTIALGAADTVLQMNAGGTAFEFALLNNANIDAAAAIAYSKLNLADSIVNADINSAAAIAYSKLNLATSIVNADISGSAAIAYSKLNLATSIVNADISGSAAIAYSKLNLATSIVNADISGSAAIAYSKLNLSTSIVNADINASAAIVYSKLSLSNSIAFSDLSSTTCTIDEDNMASNSDVRLPTQQSVKAYVDTSVAAAASVETVNTSAITGTATIGTSSASVRVCSSASAFNLTLDNTFAQGRNITIENIGTNEVTLKANDTTTICTIYRKTRCRVVNLASTPGTNTDWMVITPIVSPPIERSADFTWAAGWASTGAVSAKWITVERQGSKAYIKGGFKCGTAVAASAATIDIPADLAIDTAAYSSATRRTMLGMWNVLKTSSTTLAAYTVMYDGSDSNTIWFTGNSGSTASFTYTSQNVSDFVAANDAFTFSFEIYVAGWTCFTG